jgi:hypothetical protein
MRDVLGHVARGPAPPIHPLFRPSDLKQQIREHERTALGAAVLGELFVGSRSSRDSVA